MKFIVSGQPKFGHESWPPPADHKVLSERLYDQRGAEESTRLQVKFEKIGDRLVTYYHFSKLKDVTSCLTDEEKKANPPADHGREGSFFVMSLRIDGFYSTDFSVIYKLLDEIYENQVKGRVLKKSDKGYLVYQIMKLEDAKEIWENITSDLEIRGKNSFLKLTKPIPADISIKGTKTSDYFSVDDAAKDIENILVQKGCVILLSPKEMIARKERETTAKKQETGSDKETGSMGRITQQKFESFVQSSEDVQELASTTENSISQKVDSLVLLLTRRNDIDKEWAEKLTSLSKEQDNIIDKINNIGNNFPIPSQKEGVKNKKWLFGVLTAWGIINLILFISVINLNGKVKSLVEQIDTITIQRDSLIHGLTSHQNETKTPPVVEKSVEEVVDVNSDSEDAEITLLDLRKSDGTDVSSMQKGNSYVVTAKTGQQGSRKDAKGLGTFTCNVGVKKGINWRQDGNKCNITIYDDASAAKIILKYKYKLGIEEKSKIKEIQIQ